MFRVNIRVLLIGFLFLSITLSCFANRLIQSVNEDSSRGTEIKKEGLSLSSTDSSNEKKSLEELRKTVASFEKNENNALGLETFLKLGQYYYGLNNPDSALFYYNRALYLANLMNDSSGMARSDFFIGQLHASTGNHTLAKEYLDKAKNIYSLSKNTQDEVEVLSLLSDYDFDGYDSEDILQLYKDVIENNEGKSNAKTTAIAYMGLGKIFLNNFKYVQAYSYLLEAFNRFENAGEKVHAIKALSLIGDIFLLLEMDNEARTVFSTLISDAAPRNGTEVAVANAGLAVIYTNLDDLKTADVFAGKSVSQADSLKNDFAIERAALAKAYLLFRGNHYSEAQSWAEKARHIAVENHFRGDANASSCLISKILLNLGDFDEASRYARDALADAQEKNDVVQIKQNTAILGKIMHERGQFISSARFLNMSVEFEDSTKQIIQKIGLVEKPASIQAILLAQNPEQNKAGGMFLLRKSKFNLKQIILIFSITLLLISTVLAFIFYKNSKKSKWENETLRTSNEAINERLKKLENLLSMNSKIFTSISHDLRSPIIAVNNSIELLKYDAFDEEKKKKALDMSQDQVEATLNLLDNLLRWAKNQTEQIKPQTEAVNVCDAIFQTIKLFKTPLDKKEISFHSNCDSSVIASADNELLNIILRNLISNAMKFTPRKGSINVGASSNGTKIYVSVADTGIGISKENQNKILDPNFFITNKGTENERGSGIGLKLCMEYIRLMNGDLKLESNVGEGSRFTFSLPVYHS